MISGYQSSKLFLTISLTLLFINSGFSQSGGNDFLRSTGKIYAVVAGVVIIFMAIGLYLWRIDKKLTKLENHIKDEQ